MKLFLNFDTLTGFKKIIREQLDKLNVQYTFVGFGEIEIIGNISHTGLKEIYLCLGEYGIEVIENKKNILVQKIKDTIIEMVYMTTKLSVPNSAYISDKLKLSYDYLSSVFLEETYSSIENFILLQKIERSKRLINTNELSISEIAYMLNYSSVSHFSSQFKSVTGITPTAFHRIMMRRRDNNNEGS
jgi:AraC-like DNA-binding protein